MKTRLSFIFVLTASLFLAGCESVRNDFGAGVREKFNGPTYQTQAFNAQQPAVFDAAKASAEQLGFRITRSGAAQGVLEGVSGLASDDALRSSRQRTFKARLSTTADGSVEVAVLFTEVIEDDFAKGAGQATETSLRGSPLYPSFFGVISRALGQ